MKKIAKITDEILKASKNSNYQDGFMEVMGFTKVTLSNAAMHPKNVHKVRRRLAHFLRKERSAAQLKEHRQTLGEWLKGRK